MDKKTTMIAAIVVVVVIVIAAAAVVLTRNGGSSDPNESIASQLQIMGNAMMITPSTRQTWRSSTA